METCSVSDCGKPVLARGYCQGHYKRWRDGRPIDGPLKPRFITDTCTIDGCGRKHRARGLCGAHLERQRRGAPLDAPVREIFETDDLAARLRHYAPPGAADECWEWTRALNKGYGMISIGNSKLRGAHIVAWELANRRKLPKGMVIRHTCDNPPCTNPGHLVLGTHGDNVQDRVEHGQPNKGIDNPHATLTADDVRTIRRLAHSRVKQKAIAAQFRTTQGNISLIVMRKTWAHI